MSIRAEDSPKAFKAEVLTSAGVLAQAGTFKVQPGSIVRHTPSYKHTHTHTHLQINEHTDARTHLFSVFNPRVNTHSQSVSLSLCVPGQVQGACEGPGEAGGGACVRGAGGQAGQGGRD